MHIKSLSTVLIFVFLQLFSTSCFSESDPGRIVYDNTIVKSAVGVLRPSKKMLYIALYDVKLNSDNYETIKSTQKLRIKSSSEIHPIGYIHLIFDNDVETLSKTDLNSFTMEFSKRPDWDGLWKNRPAPDGYNWTSRNLEFIKSLAGRFEMGQSVDLITAGEKRFFIKPYPPVYAWSLELSAPILVTWDH